MKTMASKDSWFIVPKDKEANALTMIDALDCRSEEGVTVGLVDAIITIARILTHRDLTPNAVIEALKDLANDKDIKTIIARGLNE
jgi:hypothetical protein